MAVGRGYGFSDHLIVEIVAFFWSDAIFLAVFLLVQLLSFQLSSFLLCVLYVNVMFITSLTQSSYRKRGYLFSSPSIYTLYYANCQALLIPFHFFTFLSLQSPLSAFAPPSSMDEYNSLLTILPVKAIPEQNGNTSISVSIFANSKFRTDKINSALQFNTIQI